MELSNKRPTQVSKIYVCQSDLENSFMDDVRIQCDDIEKKINDVLKACQKLIDKRFVKMKNKRVWYDRDVAALYPKLDEVDMPYCKIILDNGNLNVYEGVKNFNYHSKVLTIDGIDFVLASPQEGMMTFQRGNGNPYVDKSGKIFNYKKDYGIIYNDEGPMEAFLATLQVEGAERVKKYNAFLTDDYCDNGKFLQWHYTDGKPTVLLDEILEFSFLGDEMKWYLSGILMIMIARLNRKNSPGLNLVKTLYAWLQHGLVPEGLSREEESAYNKLSSSYQDLDTYLDWTSEDDRISFRRDAFIDDVRHGRFRKNVFKLNFDFSGTMAELKAGQGKNAGNFLSLRKLLLECDYQRANLEPYADSVLSDINKGHWELFEAPEEGTIPISPKEDQVWMARPPQLDVVANGTCAIDFGTKSSVVVCRGEGGARLLRIGTGNFSKAVKETDYENPTVVDLRDLESFAGAYRNRSGRPFTKWAEVTVAHQAEEALLQQDVDSSVYYAVFSELKQWAHEKDRRLLLKDRKGKVWKLNPYLELDDEALDPIEIYAYYLGLYINNMRHGIYLDYILSFPVNYDLAVRT